MRREDETIQPLAALMTLVVPGSGYLWFRETSRAVYAFIGIAGLLLGGLLIGGIDVVDSRGATRPRRTSTGSRSTASA